ncbi:MAG: carboxylating nicotinate-nucleotide diphosphorylase [Saprospiraceae bacterium]|nr:carboxylating nicotinate-nucleotide diphosphorylase [Saprospiraceae bacterium]MBK6564721.1 carboxylating nicotinate-nucleotide diphosphorylase [Saprospiraceae bacterium]MBK7523365.1 carboxylating nicotinate-nucleotide diphosphorylase [Saprospiraceae bacterium]MBK8079462.1 carboxylating nicotinate-nucleotide diphosphorylase [Saprospiraceae bacterium]MBK8371646.1 carboxylating nicotinate-nucleotide diphosphorylase [Saprospiraceae bacterium]
MEGLDKTYIDWFIKMALDEDIKDGDHTSLACIPADSRSKAKLLVKDDGVIAGVSLAKTIFKKLDPDCFFEEIISDGQDIKYGDIAFYVECNSRALLQGERLVLNIMQRMSGIASLSNRFAFEVEGLPVTILDTRKTTPLLRLLEKWAVKIGGCSNYRIGLYDWIMIKDNHIDACGGITKAIDAVHQYLEKTQKNLKITVEVRNLLELEEVLQRGGINRIMFDNFELPILREAVAHVNKNFETEASGGVNLSTVRKIAQTGVDFISVGALTHSAGTLDLSLKVIKDK